MLHRSRPLAQRLLRSQFLASEQLQKVERRAPCELDIGRQVAVECVGDLVGVVADASQLCKVCGVHRPVSGCRNSLDFALRHQTLAQTRHGQTRFARVDGTPKVLVRREPNENLLGARVAVVGRSPGHRMTHQGWVRDAGTAP